MHSDEIPTLVSINNGQLNLLKILSSISQIAFWLGLYGKVAKVGVNFTDVLDDYWLDRLWVCLIQTEAVSLFCSRHDQKWFPHVVKIETEVADWHFIEEGSDGGEFDFADGTVRTNHFVEVRGAGDRDSSRRSRDLFSNAELDKWLGRNNPIPSYTDVGAFVSFVFFQRACFSRSDVFSYLRCLLQHEFLNF